MRNLKRALSLALAAVMVIGMMVVGAGAVSFNDFTDKDEIKNVDAVGMVTELGIINGLPNGTYGPTQNIDRASFTKMVAMAYNGGNEPILPSGNKVSYIDTANTWASQYIEYCTNLGFVAGDGTTGKFNPTANVTVSQAAKMLLVALGYNAEVEKYVGAEWQLNVDVAANTAGIYDGITGDTSANLTRDNAALLIYNALNATMVKYTYVMDVSLGQFSTKAQATTEGMKTMLEAKFNATKLEGVVLSNEYGKTTEGNPAAEGKTVIRVFKDDDTSVDYTVKASTTRDMLGQTIRVYVKNSSLSGKTYSTVYGNAILTKDNVVAVAEKKLDTVKKANDFLKDFDLTVDTKTPVVMNYGYKDNNSDDGAVSLSDTAAGVQTSFIDNNNDGKVDYIMIAKLGVGTVSVYSTKDGGSISVAKATGSYLPSMSKVDAKNVVGFDAVEKDDVVLYYSVGNTYYVEKADSIDVEVTRTKGTGEITADGKTYKESGLVTWASGSNLADLAPLGAKATLYLDKSGNVIKVTDVDSEKNYALVLETNGKDKEDGTFGSTLKAVLLMADGTKVTATINKTASDGTATAADIGYVEGGTHKPTVVTYSITSDGEYNLTPKAIAKETGVNFTKGTASIGTSVANSKTVFIVNTGDNSYKAYTGISNMPSVTEATIYTVSDKGIAQYVFITKSEGAIDAENAIYILSGTPSKGGTSDKPVYTYDVVYKGAITTMDATDSDLVAGLWTSVTLNSKGQITKVANIVDGVDQGTPVAFGKPTVVGDDALKVGTKTYAYDEDTKFFTVSKGDEAAEDAGVGEILLEVKDGDKVEQAATPVAVIADKGLAVYVFILVD